MGHESTALAGLLHDIGKFMLRADVLGRRIWDSEAQREFGYKHAMLTASFIDDFVPAPWRAQIGGLAGNHHCPQTRLERIVQLADHLSAAERDDGVQDGDVRVDHPRQLLSIFCQIEADKVRLEPAQRQYLPLQSLALADSAIFPAAPLSSDAVWRSYRDLWNQFRSDVERLKYAHETDGDLSTYLESMLLLLQRYTWCVPSAYYRSLPDITLYDHGRMTGALAAVMDRPEVDEAWLNRLHDHPETGSDEVALLVGGDISGVQDFIYTISARGATPSLRGRSFYLQLLTEAIARYVLRRLELPITNLIYAGGGNFYLLARPSDIESIQAIQRAVSRVLMQQHRGALYVAVAGVALTAADFFGGRISGAWGRLHEQLGRTKQRRFAELSATDLQHLFAPQGHGGNKERICQVCGDEHDQLHEELNEDEEPVQVCPACRGFEELGKDLRRARCLILAEADLNPVADLDLTAATGDWQNVLRALGMTVLVSEEPPTVAGDRRTLLLALDDSTLAELRPAARVAVGRRLLVNTTPLLRPDETKTLREHGELSERERSELPGPGAVKPFGVLSVQARGIRRLGVLRMDVDNLGKLFQEGLGENATLSRVAGLSFAISLYFEGWVGALAETVNRSQRHPGFPHSDRLYAIYSGGDDLFFVGSWDAVVELAMAVRRDLSRYAAGHPGIHTSGGIVLVGGKYPLAQAADDAGEAEHKAKAYRRRNGHDKDAICFLDIVQPWESFGLEEQCDGGFGSAHQLAHLLAEMTDPSDTRQKAVPQSLIRNLLEQYDQYAAAVAAQRSAGADLSRAGEPQTPFGPWMWRTVYLLSRKAERMSSEPQSKAQILALRDDLWRNGFGNIEWIGLAARWAELLTR